jgi:hypothetical protein
VAKSATATSSMPFLASEDNLPVIIRLQGRNARVI